jgi:hypothetical protein
MPEAVRTLSAEHSGETLDAKGIRNQLRAEGYAPVTRDAEDVYLQFGGDSRRRLMDRDDCRSIYAFLAESRYGVDIGFGLRGPWGQLVGADRRVDGF